MDTTELQFDSGRIDLGGIVWRTKAKEIEAKILASIPADGLWVSNQNIHKSIGGNKQAVVRELQRLVSDGVLNAGGLGTKASPKKFKIRDFG